MLITPYSQKNIATKARSEDPKKLEGTTIPDNQKSVSFTSLQDALNHIAEARSNNRIKSWRNYVRLNELDLDKISDICEGLPTFKGLTAKVLELITSSFESILLQTGCIHQCSHCGINSENKVTTMK